MDNCINILKIFMKRTILLLFVGLSACHPSKKINENASIDELAKKYVQLGLTIGAYDADFVDAYYGPPALKQQVSKGLVFPKDSLLQAVEKLKFSFTEAVNSNHNEATTKRINYLIAQLTAFRERIEIFSGNTLSFDEEATSLFGVTPPHFPDSHYHSLAAQLNNILPGNGPIPERLKLLTARFVIPRDKIDTVFKTAISEARRRTKTYYDLPSTENFALEYVTNKPWSGYNWYKGNYQSLIQINTEGPIYIERAIDLACHEGYPGHHVYNMLLEQNLYKAKGWVEISMYPLFSPQSFIAEGSANYGIELAFPGKEKNIYLKNVLLPLAGLDTTGIDAYLQALEIMRKLNYARNEVAAAFLNKQINEDEALTHLSDLGVMSVESAKKSLRFIKFYRSYVINYNYGRDLIANYIEHSSATEADRWKKFYFLLSNPVTPKDL